MIENQFGEIATFFKILADETRLKIIYLINQEELCVCDIAENLNMTHSAVSHQLSILRLARLVKSRKSGKHVYYTLMDEHVKSVVDMAYQHIVEER